jgi:hypothetical protein
MRFIGNDTERPIIEVLESYTPKIYENSKVVSEIMRVDAEELEDLYTAAQDVLNQFMIDNATWGIPLWEKSMSILSDDTKTDDERRGNIKSMVRRYGTSTIEMVKNLAESYLNGEVEIIEGLKNLIYDRKILPTSTLGAGQTYSYDSVNKQHRFIDSSTTSSMSLYIAGDSGSGRLTVLPNTVYTFSYKATLNIPGTTMAPLIYVALFDINNVQIGSTYISPQNADSKIPPTYTITTPSNCVKMQAWLYSAIANVTDAFIYDIQIEKGSAVTAYEEKKDYTLTVKFIGKRGNPSNMDDIKDAIRQVSPSHLDLIFTLTYLIWQEMEKANVTWNTADTYTWDAFETAFFS